MRASVWPARARSFGCGRTERPGPAGIREGARLGARRSVGDASELESRQQAGLIGRSGAGGLDHDLCAHGGRGHQLVLNVDKYLHSPGSDQKCRHRERTCGEEVLAERGLDLALDAEFKFGGYG
jgi:hypothetical protein